jgi:hypothetical protein
MTTLRTITTSAAAVLTLPGAATVNYILLRINTDPPEVSVLRISRDLFYTTRAHNNLLTLSAYKHLLLYPGTELKVYE